MTRSKYQIHAEIRRVFARHWIDLERIHFGAHRGIVRVTGELRHTRIAGWDASVSVVELLQSEILRIRDVTRVHFDLLNWERDDTGTWVQREKRRAEDVRDEHRDEPVELGEPTLVGEGDD